MPEIEPRLKQNINVKRGFSSNKQRPQEAHVRLERQRGLPQNNAWIDLGLRNWSTVSEEKQ